MFNCLLIRNKILQNIGYSLSLSLRIHGGVFCIPLMMLAQGIIRVETLMRNTSQAHIITISIIGRKIDLESMAHTRSIQNIRGQVVVVYTPTQLEIDIILSNMLVACVPPQEEKESVEMEYGKLRNNEDIIRLSGYVCVLDSKNYTQPCSHCCCCCCWWWWCWWRSKVSMEKEEVMKVYRN